MNEADIQNLIKLEASRKGIRLWRNNVGVLRNEHGQYVRYGLANDSAQLNAVLKSSDLIGIKPVVITYEMIGSTIGQFIAREIKASNWVYRDLPREKAQQAFINLINSLGGDADFCNGEGSL